MSFNKKDMKLLKFLFSKSFLKQIGLAIIVFLLLVFGLRSWLASTTNHEDFREVPDLIGKKIEIVKQLLAERELTLGELDYKDYNPKYPKESVVEQTPSAKLKVKKGRKIYLTINKSEYRLVKVPNLKNKTKRQAVSTLEAIGFHIGKITYKPHFAENSVLELFHKGGKIKKGEQLPYTSTIDLILGDGKLNYSQNASSEDKNTTPVENK